MFKVIVQNIKKEQCGEIFLVTEICLAKDGRFLIHYESDTEPMAYQIPKGYTIASTWIDD